MSIFDSVFPMGIGTNRFLIRDASDEDGLNQAAQVLVKALEAGCSYVDVASSYSKGFASEICRRAFERTNAPQNVTVKVSFLSDSTADSAFRRVETELQKMGLDHASFFVVWNISSYEQFIEITREGGLYEGACRAKECGLIDHICFSTHAPPDDIIRILDSGLFEGVTLSFSAINSQIMRPVLDRAAQCGVGVVVMNPLGGGVIPQQEYYSFLKGAGDDSVAQAALRYVYAHPAVKIVLSGLSSEEELNENLTAFQQTSLETSQERMNRVDHAFQNIEGFCTGCRYCDGCPKGINIFELMQAYNTRLFPQPDKLYNRTAPQLLESISICSRLKNTFGFLPEDNINPCIACGQCETKCTAHLPIMQRIAELYRRFDETCFSQASMLERLRQIVEDKRKIALYPGSGYTAFVMTLLKKAFPGADFDISLFDSNPSLWGTVTAGIKVQPPKEIVEISPELVIVSNYNYSDEIFESLTHLCASGINVVKLHRDGDVPWVF